MVSALSYFVMIFGIATSVFSLIEPWLRRLQLYFQFHQLGMDDVSEKVARAENHAAYPFLAFSLLIGIGIIVIATGLIRRREWARCAWIWGSGLLLIEAVALAAYLRDFAAPVILAIVFRLIVFAVSLRVFTSREARDQFSGGNPRAGFV